MDERERVRRRRRRGGREGDIGQVCTYECVSARKVPRISTESA